MPIRFLQNIIIPPNKTQQHPTAAVITVILPQRRQVLQDRMGKNLMTKAMSSRLLHNGLAPTNRTQQRPMITKKLILASLNRVLQFPLVLVLLIKLKCHPSQTNLQPTQLNRKNSSRSPPRIQLATHSRRGQLCTDRSFSRR